ncbi:MULTISPECIES: acetylornithine transaminase [unclassified Rhodococcus (in: high G+C Gram-positive bacteria)]|jgi:acetylornithine/N-succinyldiaminopimelate aminotransferase|uniref:acetylornithine transaminase n=1 Tax=unclassified Rhodococcus (in: high G+C Gram-positive bacteria) TaxID=192944 RepID=UPI0006F75603|nr:MULTISPECIES: acetylornithine transaminase [unclassified Rhodococcus (in: high G+C Gram-positive bacteria)]KQU31347.1 acetylornithine aminotransferase [Rhodococcus sp. Leaf225]KQU41604.1 acetylornithine aminotransferase [Rhodococcus sp. Leaf258]MBY6681555.1 acetylornithine transaminase [Rhodococcus sp. BP-316]MDQ1201898.1 acetylornithine/N-succinyldiaminopimelate aminotransferase [Rhodococcus sp. SORGH_AS_0303]
MTSTEQLQQRFSNALMNNYGVPRVALVGGSGAVVTDADGKEYLDLLAGIAVNILGHGHPAVVEAVSAQLTTLGHTSNLYAAPPSIELAEHLLEHLGHAAGGDARVFLCNSGTEANEAAFKIARLTGRPNIIAAENAFHGRTMGALALTGQADKRAPFEPMPAGVSHVPYGDIAALEAAVDENTAAVFLEPIMGEGGVVVPPEGYLPAAREITARHGALLILDEVQTGIGRTGWFYAHQRFGIVPDVITLAKGLGGGLPIGACIGIGPAAAMLTPGKHGTTFGGNPVCSAAALAVLRTLASEDLLSHADRLGKILRHDIEALGHPLVDHVRGAGLLLGIVLTEPVAADVETAARHAGFLVNAAQANVLRLAPPLIITDEQAASFVRALPAVLDEARPTAEATS